MRRGEVWWIELGDPVASEPGYRRPVVIVQSDAFNQSRISTVIAVVLTSSMRLLDAPGNSLAPRAESGLPRDSVVNVSQLLTLDRSVLVERVGRLPRVTMTRVDAGVRLVLGLGGGDG